MLTGASTSTTGTSGQRKTPTHSTVTAVMVSGSGPGDVWTAAEGAAPEDGFCEYSFYNCAGTDPTTPTAR